ncbi:Lamin-B receptor [Nymphon striatum]|nr:Lamin-B receptor [Nymphon striatum]
MLGSECNGLLSNALARTKMPTKDTMKEGDTIMAKWPGSTLYYDAQVLKVTDDLVTVVFGEGTEEVIPFKYVYVKLIAVRKSFGKYFGFFRPFSPPKMHLKSRQESSRSLKLLVLVQNHQVADQDQDQEAEQDYLLKISHQPAHRDYLLKKSHQPAHQDYLPEENSPTRTSRSRQRSKSPARKSTPSRSSSRSRSNVKTEAKESSPKTRKKSMEETKSKISDETPKHLNSKVVQRKLTPTRSSSRIAALKKPDEEFVVINFTRFMVSSVAFAALLAFVLHIKSYWADESEWSPDGNTDDFEAILDIFEDEDDIENQRSCNELEHGCPLTDYFYGREYFPRFMSDSYDVKVLAMRIQTITWVVMILEVALVDLYAAKEIKSANPSVVLMAIFQISYVVSMLYYEKHRFRTDPSDPRVSHLETIVTGKGKNLLVSGWWGWVCHPNYFGEFLVNLCFSIICGYNHLFPHIMFIFTIYNLLIRSYADDKACAEKYGTAWQKYRQQTKYRIIPYVW